jgi:hypothetical protein
MDPLLMVAYRELEDVIRKALKEHSGNGSVMSTMLNTLLLYPDHPYGLGTLYGKEFDERTAPLLLPRRAASGDRRSSRVWSDF